MTDINEAETERIKGESVRLQGMIREMQQELGEQMENGQNVRQSHLTTITHRKRTMESLIENSEA